MGKIHCMVEDNSISPYKPILDRSSEILSSIETQFDNRYRLSLIDTTPGLWPNQNNQFVVGRGETYINTVVLQRSNYRVSLSEVTHTEEEFDSLDLDSRLLVITRRPYPPTNSRMCISKALLSSNKFVRPAIVHTMESDMPNGTIEKTLNIFYEQGSRLSKENAEKASQILDLAVQERPILVDDTAAYYPSFDAAFGDGLKEMVTTGLQKDGFDPNEFVHDALLLLNGDPTPLSIYDLAPTAHSLIQAISENNRNDPRLKHLQWDLLSLPQNGYPRFPE